MKSRESGETNDKEEGEEDGEKEESELEEGELSDGDDARPEETEPRPVCRFYNRGQCTWGVSCRFLHPGVTDKGNYTMFDMVRPMAYPPHATAPHEYRSHIDRPSIVRSLSGYGAPAHAPKVEEVPTESAWERGLRHAKEVRFFFLFTRTPLRVRRQSSSKMAYFRFSAYPLTPVDDA